MRPESDGRRIAWLAGALLASLLPVFLAQPFWQTVDDAITAMIVHGYGISATPEIGVVTSSVLFAWLVQSLPRSIGGAQSYGVSLYVLLACAGMASAWVLWRARVQGALAAAALLAVYVPAALYPQFTVVAGLASVAGLLLVATDARAVAVVTGTVLLLLAGLLRPLELIMVVLLTLPLWGAALRDAPAARVRVAAGALVCVALGVALGVAIDDAYFGAPQWRQFVAMNEARLPFTDYGLRQYFMARPLDAMRLGFTPNDLIMLEGWFFTDPRVFPPARINELASHAPLLERVPVNFARMREVLAPFQDESFAAMLLLALVTAWRARSRTTLWSLATLGVVMIALLLTGRPGTTRIYVPALAGILLFALTLHSPRVSRLECVAGFALLAIFAGILGARNASDRVEAQEFRERLCRIPKDRLYIAWGDKLPYEKLYRPLAAPGDGCAMRIYPLAVQSYAPYAVAQLRAATGATDVVAALVTGSGLDLIAEKWQIETLRRHLRLHYGRDLDWELRSGNGTRGSWYAVRLRSQ